MITMARLAIERHESSFPCALRGNQAYRRKNGSLSWL